MTGELDLSVVLPVHNEVLNLPILWEEIAQVLAAGGWRAEVIFVDDGSTDGSAEALASIARGDPRVRVIRFAANAGLSAALAAGLHRARGRIVVSMDSDLQSDPRDIPQLLAPLGEWDAATGRRRRRQDPWLKRVSSRVANAIRNRVTGDHVEDSACTLRAMHRRCVADLPLFQGFHRFVPTLLRMAGHRVVEVPVHHRPRRHGVSHFGIRNRAWRGMVDLFAVRWMQRRRLRYTILDDKDEVDRE
jgi:glycosyltransferase involved in cell wall biosynthesis